MMPAGTVIGPHHVVVARSATHGLRKLFAVGFGRDGSVFVHLPYFAESHGYLCRSEGRCVDGEARILSVGLRHLTTRRVKFTYHPDGHAHFSQDGQVKTLVRVHLPHLSSHGGMLFLVACHGLDQFEAAIGGKASVSRRRSVVECTPSETARGIAVTGYISKPGVLLPVESAEPPVCVAASLHSSFLIALGYKVDPEPSNYSGSHLLFLGGPSDGAIIARGSARSVLLAVYPRGAAPHLFPTEQNADFEALS